MTKLNIKENEKYLIMTKIKAISSSAPLIFAFGGKWMPLIKKSKETMESLPGGETGVRRRKMEDGRPKRGVRRPKTEDGRRKAEVRRRKMEVRSLKMEGGHFSLAFWLQASDNMLNFITFYSSPFEKLK